MYPDKIFYEPAALNYELGKYLKCLFKEVPWVPIENHNNIEQLRKNPNSEFIKMKRHIIIGVRKSLKHTPNQKASDYLVPYTSSGCGAMCLYCYLVCHYNKCAYLRLFVNREKMLDKLMKAARASERELVFEIGSNSDLILENTITKNLEWTIQTFARQEKGLLTFPTKFHRVEPLLPLAHKKRVIVRMSVNPQPIIRKVEFGTSSLKERIRALNLVCDAGYKTGLLIAPVILMEGWKDLYAGLIDRLADELSPKIKAQTALEIIFMTYSYVHRAINREAFPGTTRLYDADLMTGRGRGRYCYRKEARAEGEQFLKEQLSRKLPGMPILYIV